MSAAHICVGISFFFFFFFFFFSENKFGWGSTSHAFIFSLHDKEGLSPFKSMVKNEAYAMLKQPDSGPVFGDDIVLVDNKNNLKSYSRFGSYYSVPNGVQNRLTILAGTQHFSPDELEVFYLGSP